MRSFDIGASAVLLNKGDSASYRAALGVADGQSSGYDITLSDLRVYDENIDRGAYENNQRLYPVLYVQPGKTLDGDGTTWEKAFGQGRLQEAVDLCAVYVATRKDGGDATVFVKGGRTGRVGYDAQRCVAVWQRAVELYRYGYRFGSGAGCYGR